MRLLSSSSIVTDTNGIPKGPDMLNKGNLGLPKNTWFTVFIITLNHPQIDSRAWKIPNAVHTRFDGKPVYFWPLRLGCKWRLEWTNVRWKTFRNLRHHGPDDGVHAKTFSVSTLFKSLSFHGLTSFRPAKLSIGHNNSSFVACLPCYVCVGFDGCVRFFLCTRRKLRFLFYHFLSLFIFFFFISVPVFHCTICRLLRRLFWS